MNNPIKQGPKPVVALFQDSADEMLWNNELADIRGLVRILASEHLSLALAKVEQSGGSPLLFIISSSVYLQCGHTLVPFIREKFPHSELLIIAPDEQPPPLRPLAADEIRHLVVKPNRGGNRLPDSSWGQLALAVANLEAGRPWMMNDYLIPGTMLFDFAVGTTDQKEELIAKLLAVVKGDSEELELLRQKGALLADEMLENALYGAPRSSDGGQLYRKGERRELSIAEKVRFRFGFDGITLALEVADNWGSLPSRVLLEHLARNQETAELAAEGGRGLFIIWRFFDQLLVNIVPGSRTVVGGHIRIDSGLDPMAPKGFHICMQP